MAGHAPPTHRIVELATRAPSIHNTQPWRWRAAGDVLELHADVTHQLRVADPLGRNLTISCGAALHQALVGAAALGWVGETVRFPDGPSSTLLARVTLRPGPPSQSAQADLTNIAERCTDRRRFTSWPIPEETLQRLARVAEQPGTHALPIVDVSERLRAEMLVERAATLQANDTTVAAEQRSWIDHSPVDGIPTAVLPAERPAMTAQLRSGYPSGRLDDPGREIESADGLIVICAETDDATAWLPAGEALSALWLEATSAGLSVVPLSQVVEVAQTRHELSEQVFGGLTHPLILVRIGWQAISRSQVVRTARRRVDDVLEQA